MSEISVDCRYFDTLLFGKYCRIVVEAHESSQSTGALGDSTKTNFSYRTVAWQNVDTRDQCHWAAVELRARCAKKWAKE
jgi:hypothetical protein